MRSKIETTNRRSRGSNALSRLAAAQVARGSAAHVARAGVVAAQVARAAAEIARRCAARVARADAVAGHVTLIAHAFARHLLAALFGAAAILLARLRGLLAAPLPNFCCVAESL